MLSDSSHPLTQVTLATYATFVLSQPNSFLDPGKTFVTLALFSILRTPMDFMSTMISFFVQVSVCWVKDVSM